MTDIARAASRKTSTTASASAMDLVGDIPVRLSVEVGSIAIPLVDLLGLGESSVVELDRQSDELLDVMANGKLIARGEVVTLGTRFGIRLVEVVSGDSRLIGVERRS